MKNTFIFKFKTLFSLLFIFSFFLINAQDYCYQTEYVNIYDNNATFTINLSDITCNSGNLIESIFFNISSDGYNNDSGTPSSCGSEYTISYNLDGDITTNECSPYLYSYSFNSLTVTVSDLDGQYDQVFLSLFIDVYYSAPCLEPSSLAATNITESGATLSLIEEGNANTWNWYITPYSWDTPYLYDQTLYTYSETVVWYDGTPGTTYYAYGRSECSYDYEYGRSDYVGPIIFTTLATCSEPSNLTATNQTTTGATLGLTENGTASNWDWYIVPTGNTAPTESSTPTINDTTNPTNWSGGTDGTMYDAYVRADCNTDNTNVSIWVGPIMFTTLDHVICPANNTLFETTYTATGWTNGLPDSNKCAVIDHDFSTSSFTAYNTTVNATKTLTIAANTFMQVQKEIVNNGAIIVETSAAVVQIDDTATVTGTGTFSTKVTTTALQDANRFTYFSSPSATGNLSTFSGFSSANWAFDSSIQNWNYLGDGTATNTMIAGSGYAVKGGTGSSEEVTFNGAFNNGVVSKTIHFDVYNNVVANFANAHATSDDSNFYGNPYPSAIDATALLTLNPQANALYFWTHESALPASGNFTTDDYAVRTLTGSTNAPSGGTAPTHIASGQGFFIEANANGTFTFNNSLRTTDNNDQFRNPEIVENKIWLNLSSLDNTYSNQILVAFLENATIANDAQYDAERLGNNYALSFYSNGLNEERYAIQARPLLTNEDIVPLGMYVNETSLDHLKISIDHIELLDNVSIYLKDNLLNTTHDLKQSDYHFSIVSPTELNNRFELLFNRNALSINDDLINNNLIVSNQNEAILVSVNNGNKLANIKVFDILGKQISNTKENSERILIPTTLQQGTVLIIKATLENGAVLHKKFIKL